MSNKQIYVFRRARAGGGIVTRNLTEEGPSILDVFKKHSAARKFCQEVHEQDDFDLSAIAYQKIKTDKFIKMIPTFSLSMGTDLIMFGEHNFPLTTSGIELIGEVDPDCSQMWSDLLTDYGETALWYAVALWWSNFEEGVEEVITPTFVEDNIPEEIGQYMRALQGKLEELSEKMKVGTEAPTEVQESA